MRGYAVLATVLGFFSVIASASAADMRFRWVSIGDPRVCGANCPKVMEAQGTITTETPREFQRFVEREGDTPGARRAVLLHSPGGVLKAGMELGLMFRKLGMIVFVGRFMDAQTLAEAGVLTQLDSTRSHAFSRSRDRAVTGTCVSACVYAFLGGAERIVPGPSRLGVHRPYRDEDRYTGSPSQDPSALVAWDLSAIERVQADYVKAMGADPALINIERGVPSRTIKFLSAQELRRLRITTRGQ